MNRIFSVALLGTISLGLTGILVGCHASADVDAPKSSTTDSSYKKTTVKDANGNVVEQKVEKTSN